LDPTVPDEALKEIRLCIRRGDVHEETSSFQNRVGNIYNQIIDHNVHQCYLDHDQPAGDQINIRAELFLEAAQQLENALDNLGGATRVGPPVIGVSESGEVAIQTAYVIVDGVSTRMSEEGRTLDNDPLWWNYRSLDLMFPPL
jgi:hypothetical protein